MAQTEQSMIAIRDQVDEMTESSRAYYSRLAAQAELIPSAQHLQLRPPAPARAGKRPARQPRLAKVIRRSSQGISELSSPLSD